MPECWDRNQDRSQPGPFLARDRVVLLSPGSGSSIPGDRRRDAARGSIPVAHPQLRLGPRAMRPEPPVRRNPPPKLPLCQAGESHHSGNARVQNCPDDRHCDDHPVGRLRGRRNPGRAGQGRRAELRRGDDGLVRAAGLRPRAAPVPTRRTRRSRCKPPHSPHRRPLRPRPRCPSSRRRPDATRGRPARTECARRGARDGHARHRARHPGLRGRPRQGACAAPPARTWAGSSTSSSTRTGARAPRSSISAASSGSARARSRWTGAPCASPPTARRAGRCSSSAATRFASRPEYKPGEPIVVLGPASPAAPAEGEQAAAPAQGRSRTGRRSAADPTAGHAPAAHRPPGPHAPAAAPSLRKRRTNRPRSRRIDDGSASEGSPGAQAAGGGASGVPATAAPAPRRPHGRRPAGDGSGEPGRHEGDLAPSSARPRRLRVLRGQPPDRLRALPGGLLHPGEVDAVRYRLRADRRAAS